MPFRPVLFDNWRPPLWPDDPSTVALETSVCTAGVAIVTSVDSEIIDCLALEFWFPLVVAGVSADSLEENVTNSFPCKAEVLGSLEPGSTETK